MERLVDRRLVLVSAAIVGAVTVGVLVGRPAQPGELPAVVATPMTVGETRGESLVVHVSGEVVRPGLVEVAVGARVADVVAAAGGATHLADLDRINLALPVVDGQQVVIPTSAAGVATPTGSAESDPRVHVNTADPSVLESLPGVGPVLAAAIVAHRTEHGPFDTAEDLLDVPGIGERKLASLRDLVTVP